MDRLHTAAALFKCLGDETRLSIAQKLAHEDREVNSKDIITDCSVALRLSQPTMSYHFQALVAAGVLRERKVGVEKYYRLNRERLNSAGIDLRNRQGGKI